VLEVKIEIGRAAFRAIVQSPPAVFDARQPVAVAAGRERAGFDGEGTDRAVAQAYIVGQCAGRQARTVEPTQEGEDAWVQAVVDCAVLRRKFQEECTPGYYNNEGRPSALSARNGPYGKGPIAFVQILEA